ncbi:hypothetical protein [Intestinibacter sp.]
MAFTSIILIMVALLLIGFIIGLITKSKKLSTVCGVLAILVFIFGLLVFIGILQNCE